MPTTSRPRSLARTASLLGAAGMLALTLSACGGEASVASDGASSSSSGLDGVYYNEDGRLTISGDRLVYERAICDKGTFRYKDEPYGQGSLTDDKTQVVWDSDDELLGGVLEPDSSTSPIVLTEAGENSVLTIDGDIELRTDSTPMDEKQQACES